MRWVYLFVLSLWALILVACGDDPKIAGDKTTEDGTEESLESPAMATLSPVIVHLQQDYEALRAGHQAISDIWEGLAAGEQVQCGEYPDVLDPDSISAEGDPTYETLADLLRRAAIDTGQAVKLWKAECANPRATPAPSVIDEGRLAARAAGDALKEAEVLLRDIQR